MSPYAYLLALWGGLPPMAVNVKPTPSGVRVTTAASPIQWQGQPPPAANDP